MEHWEESTVHDDEAGEKNMKENPTFHREREAAVDTTRRRERKKFEGRRGWSWEGKIYFTYNFTHDSTFNPPYTNMETSAVRLNQKHVFWFRR